MNVNIEQPVIDTLKQLLIAARSLTELTIEDQAHLASWILKVIICADPHSFSREEKDRFRGTGVAASTDAIWLGQMTPPAERHENNLAHLSPKDFGKLMVNRRRALPMGMYRLFSLFVSKLDPFQPDVELPMTLDLSRHLVQIWPARDTSIPWPPRMMDGAVVAAVENMLRPELAPTLNGQPLWFSFRTRYDR
jgi:hypothetical protein